MFELLEKTNQRVQLDRPFLIREKMQVIMIDSDRQGPKPTPRIPNEEKGRFKKRNKSVAIAGNLPKVGRLETRNADLD